VANDLAELSISSWGGTLAKTSNDEDEYRRRAQGFKTTCQALSKVLTLEKQILFSPLTKTFTEKLDEIKSSWG